MYAIMNVFRDCKINNEDLSLAKCTAIVLILLAADRTYFYTIGYIFFLFIRSH